METYVTPKTKIKRETRENKNKEVKNFPEKRTIRGKWILGDRHTPVIIRSTSLGYWCDSMYLDMIPFESGCVCQCVRLYHE